MPMNREHKKRLFFYSNVKKCAACGSGKLDAGEVIETSIRRTTLSDPGGRTAYMAQLCCEACGHIMLFDAAKMKIASSPFKSYTELTKGLKQKAKAPKRKK